MKKANSFASLTAIILLFIIGCKAELTKIEVESISLSETTLTLASEATKELMAMVMPDNADDKTVKWSSSNVDVATVDSNGIVRAIKPGEATITAQAGDITALCIVTVKSASIMLNTTTLVLMPDMTWELMATVISNSADDKTVKWSSSNVDVATVDTNGIVRAIKPGEATITAQAGEKEATCTLTVKPRPVEVESVTLNKTMLTLMCGETEKLSVTITPDNADDARWTWWWSSDSDIAIVDDYGTVTAVKEGIATITARSGNIMAECEVTVNPISIDNVTLNETTLQIEPGKTKKLIAIVITSYYFVDKTVKWSSSDETVATVDNEGTITAVTEGTAIITAQAGDKEAECTVTVCIHSYSDGKCTMCGAVPYLEDGTIDDNGVLKKYYGSYKTTTVVIPKGVTGIGNGAFSASIFLSNVTIPNSVASIGNRAFYYCTDLNSMTIPDSVTSIGNSAFAYCMNLSSITIPGSVTNIGSDAFFHCSRLRNIIYTGTLAQWCAMNNGGNFMNTTVTIDGTDLKSMTKLVIPNSVTSIGGCAFYRCTSLSNVTIPDSVTSIGWSAFNGCTSLTDVTIPDSVTSIGGYAFAHCTSLANVTISSNVTSIGYGAFYECTSLTDVMIPNSVTSIEDNVFYSCTNLKKVTYDGTEEEWNRIEGIHRCGLSGIIITGIDGSTWRAR